MSQADAVRSALLIIDMQVGLLCGTEMPHDGTRVLSNINMLIGRARQAGVPIYAARHTGPQGSPIEAGSPWWQLHPELAVDAAVDRIFDKTRPSCFAATPLAEELRQARIGRLVIVGMKTQYCVDTTCRAASELGLQAVLVADAHTCMDTPQLPAASIIAHHNATLNGPFATVQATDSVQF